VAAYPHPPPVTPGHGSCQTATAAAPRRRCGSADDAVRVRASCDLDPQPEPHAREPRREVAARAIDDQPRAFAVVHDGGRVLDVPLRVEHEQLGALPGRAP
jgi:hypothetical protein